MELAIITPWDGYGHPTDGGVYEERGVRPHEWYQCLLCGHSGRGADLNHCQSEGHLRNLRHHLAVTRQARPVANPKALPPPPPAAAHDPLPGLAAPLVPPVFTSTRELLEKMEENLNERIDELTVKMDAMSTKLDTLIAAVNQLPAGSQTQTVYIQRPADHETSWAPSLCDYGTKWAAAAEASESTSDSKSKDDQWVVPPAASSWTAAAAASASTDHAAAAAHAGGW